MKKTLLLLVTLSLSALAAPPTGSSPAMVAAALKNRDKLAFDQLLRAHGGAVGERELSGAVELVIAQGADIGGG